MGGPPQARELPGPPSRSSSGAAPAPGGPTMSDAELKRMAGSRLQSLFTGEDVVDEILDFFKVPWLPGLAWHAGLPGSLPGVLWAWILCELRLGMHVGSCTLLAP